MIVAVLVRLLNWLVKPVITLFALPVPAPTLGLALFFTRMLMLELMSVLVSGFDTTGLAARQSEFLCSGSSTSSSSVIFDPEVGSPVRSSRGRPGRVPAGRRRSTPTYTARASTPHPTAHPSRSRVRAGRPETIQNAATYLAAFARAAFDEGDPDVATVEPGRRPVRGSRRCARGYCSRARSRDGAGPRRSRPSCGGARARSLHGRDRVLRRRRRSRRR